MRTVQNNYKCSRRTASRSGVQVCKHGPHKINRVPNTARGHAHTDAVRTHAQCDRRSQPKLRTHTLAFNTTVQPVRPGTDMSCCVDVCVCFAYGTACTYMCMDAVIFRINVHAFAHALRTIAMWWMCCQCVHTSLHIHAVCICVLGAARGMWWQQCGAADVPPPLSRKVY